MKTKLLKLTIEIQNPNSFIYHNIKLFIKILGHTLVKYNMIVKNELNINNKIVVHENNFHGNETMLLLNI